MAPPSHGLLPVPATIHSVLRVTVYGTLSMTSGWPAVPPVTGSGLVASAIRLGPLALPVNVLREISSSRAARSDAATRLRSERTVFMDISSAPTVAVATKAKIIIAHISSIMVIPASSQLRARRASRYARSTVRMPPISVTGPVDLNRPRSPPSVRAGANG